MLPVPPKTLLVACALLLASRAEALPHAYPASGAEALPHAHPASGAGALPHAHPARRAEASPASQVGQGFSPASSPAFDPADRSAWLALKDSGFQPPPGVAASDVLAAVEPLLGSPDPVLRDEVGYGLAVAWIYRERRVPDEAIRAFARRLRANLREEGDGDAVLRRSFSALLLSIVAASDLKAPLLEDDERHALVEDAAAFLVREPDTRGYDPRLGWVHATAHTADLLKFLARSPRLSAGEERAIADAVLARVDRAGPVFAWGEDDRLAAVLVSLARRPGFDASPLDRWMSGIPPAWKALWDTPALDTAGFARLVNARHLLRSLYLALVAPGAPASAGDLAARVRRTLDGLD
jgi:hypothetical protein